MAVDNDGPTGPRALVLGGDRRTQMLAHVLLTELGSAACVAPSLASMSPTASPDRVRALVVIRTDMHTSTTRLIMGLRHRGYRAPLVVLCSSPSERVRQRAFMLGAADVISLPARDHEVAVRLRLALAAPSAAECAH